MKTWNALSIVVCLGLGLAAAAAGADPPPSMNDMPTPPGVAPGVRGHVLLLGPTDYTGIPRSIKGIVRIMCRGPQGSNAAVVEIFVDGKSVGKIDKQPLSMDYDASKLSKGEHIFKAVGSDANGAQLWAATTKAVTDTTSRAPSMPTSPTAPPSIMGPSAGPSRAPAVPAAPAAPPASSNAAVEPVLNKTYSSAKYGFSINYPQDWTAADETASMKPKVPGGVWIVLSAKAGSTLELVVNVRRQKLEAGTNADTFAKYNDYVQSWEKKTVLDSPAFATTTTSPGQSRVVHRLIVIKDGMAWMFNCIDKNGSDVDASRRLFNAIVNSLGSPQTAPVSIQEVRPRKGK